MVLTFDFGLLYKRKHIKNVSELIEAGIGLFKQAISLTSEEVTVKDENKYYQEEDEPHITHILKILVKSFAHFVVVDEYEILLELIKGHLKYLKTIHEKSADQKNQEWVLKKFMIALDIHFYLKCGSIKNAA